LRKCEHYDNTEKFGRSFCQRITGFGNTGLMAKAIAEGAMNAGLDVILKKVDEVSPGDVENADAIAIGLATYKGAGMPTVIKYAESLAKVPVKGKVGTSFGSYGWSGEGPLVVTKMLLSYGMNSQNTLNCMMRYKTLFYGSKRSRKKRTN
jgi:flavorubredoxin